MPMFKAADLILSILISNLTQTPFVHGYHDMSTKPSQRLHVQYFNRLKEEAHEHKKTNSEDKQVKKKYSNNNTVYDNDIPHLEALKSHPDWNEINVIEEDFRNLLAMKSYNYFYKRRGTYWRTWRKFVGEDGKTNIICYKCNNVIGNTTCATCHGNGFWEIEEDLPPCPYELFSVINADKLCAASVKQFKDLNEACPAQIHFSELMSTCDDNPIHTNWHFTKSYSGNISERFSVICRDKEICQFETVYAISPEQVVFRIINPSNNIIYSRIMRESNKIYACIGDCGRIDPVTNKVTKETASVKKMKGSSLHSPLFPAFNLSLLSKQNIISYIRGKGPLLTKNKIYIFTKKPKKPKVRVTTEPQCKKLLKQYKTKLEFENTYNDVYYEDD